MKFRFSTRYRNSFNETNTQRVLFLITRTGVRRSFQPLLEPYYESRGVGIVQMDKLTSFLFSFLPSFLPSFQKRFKVSRDECR